MGRRKKAAKKVVKKKAARVPTQFKCIFCSTEDSVIVKLDFISCLGSLQCKYCNEKFQTRIHNLSDPIDVFSDWFDETVRKQEEENSQFKSKAGIGGEGGGGEDDEGDEGFGRRDEEEEEEEEEGEGEDVEDDR